MAQQKHPSSIERFKVPAIVVGAGLSLVAHAAAVVVIGVVVSGSSRQAPRQIVSRGEPIRVYLRDDTEDAIEAELNEPILEVAAAPTEAGISSESNPPLTPEVAADLALSQQSLRPQVVPPVSPEMRSSLQRMDGAAIDTLTSVTLARSVLAAPAGETRARPLTPHRASDSVIPELPTPNVQTHIAPPSVAASSPVEVTSTADEQVSPAQAGKPPTPVEPAPKPRELGVERNAEAIDVPSPVYPNRSIRLGQQGDVEIAVEVLASGQVGEVVLHKQSRHRLLNQAALSAAKKAHFHPAMLDGVAVASTVILPFEFRLH